MLKTNYGESAIIKKVVVIDHFFALKRIEIGAFIICPLCHQEYPSLPRRTLLDECL